MELERRVAEKIKLGDKTAESEYLSMIYEDSIQQYADYFESEGEENVEYLRKGVPGIVSGLMLSYRDYSKLGQETRVNYLHSNIREPTLFLRGSGTRTSVSGAT